MKRQKSCGPRLGKLVHQLPGVVTFAYNLCFRHMIARWKGIIEEIHFGGSIIPLDIIGNLNLEKPSFWSSTSTYCKNFDVLFATLWTKLAILSKNRGNFFFFPYCPITSHVRRHTNICLYFHIDVAIETPLDGRLSCHVCNIVVSLATFCNIVVSLATFVK
jgi:hypothetical protein